MSVTPDVKTQEAVQTRAPAGRRRRGSAPSELNPGERRLGLTLVLPTILVLAVVIGYPVVRAIIMSFQKDPGLDPATGLFVSGGNAGVSNYTHWLAEQCNNPAGGTVHCPPGTLGGQFWDSMFTTVFFAVCTVVIEVVLGMCMAVVMNCAFSGRSLLRVSVIGHLAILTGGGGGTGHATTTLSILVVDQIRQGFNSAAALSTITFLFIFLVAFIFVKFLGANVVQTQQRQQKGAL